MKLFDNRFLECIPEGIKWCNENWERGEHVIDGIIEWSKGKSKSLYTDHFIAYNIFDGLFVRLPFTLYTVRIQPKFVNFIIYFIFNDQKQRETSIYKSLSF